MKKFIFGALAVVAAVTASAAEPPKYNELYYQRATVFAELPVHLLGNGYVKWRDLLLPYVNE